MSQADETFFTSVGCMDGRVQAPIAKFGKEKLGALYPDTITEAGLVGLLASEDPDLGLIESLKKKINISLEKHNSRGILVHGHQECAGNPVDDEKHKDHIRQAVGRIKEIVGKETSVFGAFIKRDGSEWIVEEILDTIIA